MHRTLKISCSVNQNFYHTHTTLFPVFFLSQHKESRVMTKRISGDHDRFRQVVAGRKHKALKDRMSTGQIFGTRSKDGKTVGITMPHVTIPGFRVGKAKSGMGRGDGKPGDVIGRDKKKGKGGNQAG